VTKDEAYEEALRRWRELPETDRQEFGQAQVFAAGLADELDFRTMGNERKVIAAWLVRDIVQTGKADEPAGDSPAPDSIGPHRPPDPADGERAAD